MATGFGCCERAFRSTNKMILFCVLEAIEEIRSLQWHGTRVPCDRFAIYITWLRSANEKTKSEENCYYIYIFFVSCDSHISSSYQRPIETCTFIYGIVALAVLAASLASSTFCQLIPCTSFEYLNAVWPPQSLSTWSGMWNSADKSIYCVFCVCTRCSRWRFVFFHSVSYRIESISWTK